MDSRKQAIVDALRRWIAQRPGLEFGNYGNVPAYRAELRSITRDKHDAERLLDAVASLDSITADDMLAASRGAFSGRLRIEGDYEFGIGDIRIEYDTGQYWPTEYRKAAAAVCASALWNAQRDELDQVPARVPDSRAEGEPTKYLCSTNGKWLREGDWLRTSFRHWFGRGIQQRWFN